MTPSDDFDYEQEERDIGAAFRALLPPPPVPATPDELDAAFFAAIRTFPVGSVAPHPPDIASRLVPIARRAVARARRRTFLRRVAVCFLAAVFLVGCATISSFWRRLFFTDGSGKVSDEWLVCGTQWKVGKDWAECGSVGTERFTAPLLWNGTLGTNTEFRTRMRLLPDDDPIHGARISLTSGMEMYPGVEILFETNRVGIAVGPAPRAAIYPWALSGEPGAPLKWFPRHIAGRDVPIRIVWFCGQTAVFVGDDSVPLVQTASCARYYDPDWFTEPGRLSIFATGVRLSGLAVRPSDSVTLPPSPNSKTEQ